MKRILHAYKMTDHLPNPTLVEVAKEARVPRSAVSGSNEFLRSLGLLERRKRKLTFDGVGLAAVLAIGTRPEKAAAIERIVSSSRSFLDVLNAVPLDGWAETVMHSYILTQAEGDRNNSGHVAGANTIMDILEEAELIERQGRNVRLTQRGMTLRKRDLRASDGKKSALASTPVTQSREIRIPLGLDRFVHLNLILPSDWQEERDGPRFLKMLQLMQEGSK